jgi:hypothetical protein
LLHRDTPSRLRSRWVKLRVRRETGKEQVVQVHYDEGVAIRIGPAPCAGSREGAGEASAGVCAGQPSSRESDLFSGADAVLLAEGNTDGRVIASALMARRGRRPWHAQKLLEREPGDLTVDQQRLVLRAVLVRIGKARSRSR